MRDYECPIINELSLRQIENFCKSEFNIYSKQFDLSVFGHMGYKSKMLDGSRKIKPLYVDNLITFIGDLAKTKGVLFRDVIVKWVPCLEAYSDEEIRNIIEANLMKTASSDVPLRERKSPAYSSMQFLKSCMNKKDSKNQLVGISSVYMAFQTGWLWVQNQEQNELLFELADKGIPIHLVTNTAEVIQTIAPVLWDESKRRIMRPANTYLDDWHRYEKSNTNIELRISDYPVLKRTILVKYHDDTSEIWIRDYTYSQPQNEASPYFIFKNTDSFYNNYKAELDFLWDGAKTYEQWKASRPSEKKIMSQGRYVILYLSHLGSELDDGLKMFIYSSMAVGRNNDVLLRINLPESALMEDVDSAHSEYGYRGEIRVADDSNAFVHTQNEKGTENVTIALKGGIVSGRYLGILSGLSPSGYPVSFKCVCIPASEYEHIDMNKVFRLLVLREDEKESNMLKLESRDIDLLSSRWIMQ